MALYIDGAYVERSFGGLYDILDPASVQVLKGPQGSLYGRNATGGAVLVNTADPTSTFGGQLSAEIGSEDHYLAQGVVNVPLTDDLDARVAVRYRTDGGYIKNLADGEELGRHEAESGRIKLAYHPISNLSIVVEGQYDRDDSSPNANSEFLPAPYCALCGVDPNIPVKNFYTTSINTIDNNGGSRDSSLFFDSIIRYQLGPLNFEDTTSYRHTSSYTIFDADFSDQNFENLFQQSGNSTVTQDFQISTNTHKWYNATIGISYLHDQSYEDLSFSGDALAGVVTATGADPANHTQVTTNSVSEFFDIVLEPIRHLKITGGGRYTDDTRSINAQDNPGALLLFGGGTVTGARFTAPDISFTNFSPRVTIAYDFGVANVYGSYNKGFKAGGFNAPDYALPPVILQPETIDGYEVGVKYVSRDRKVRLNVAGFYYDYDNVQETVGCIPCGGTVLQNAASATGKGVEYDGDYLPVRWLEFIAGGSYLDATFDKYPNASQVVVTTGPNGQPTGIVQATQDLSGTRLPHAPKWSGYVGVTLQGPLGDRWTGELTGLVHYTTDFDFFPGADGQLRASRQDGYQTVTLSGTIRPVSGPYSIGFYIENLTDAQYADFRFTNAPLGALQDPARPRTFGVKLGYTF